MSFIRGTMKGVWNDELFNGTILYANGDNYTGEVSNFKKWGKGVMNYKNGNMYDGFWRNDSFYGKGIYTIGETNTKLDGEWTGFGDGKGKVFYDNNIAHFNKVWKGFAIQE